MAVSEIKIQPFQNSDINRIMEIEKRSFPYPWSKKSYLGMSMMRTTRFLVAKDESKILGFVLYQLLEDEIEIHSIAVDPDSRRRGVSRKMFNFILDEAREKGIKQIFLQVRRSNESARSLYKKFGFRIIGTRPNHYEDGEDALVMKLEIE